MSGWLALGLGACYLPMLFEWRRSRANEHALRGRGAVEPAGDVIGAMSLVYPASFALMAAEGWWRGQPGSAWMTAGASAYVLAKSLKYWAIATLGSRWTFRVLVPPREPLVAGGPYRWLPHPNYVGVAGEFLASWWWFGAWWTGPSATVVFLFLMWKRVQIEDHALRAHDARPGIDS